MMSDSTSWTPISFLSLEGGRTYSSGSHSPSLDPNMVAKGVDAAPSKR